MAEKSNRVNKGMLAIEMAEPNSVSISSTKGRAMGKGKRDRGVGDSASPSKVQKVSASTAWSDPRSGSDRGSGTLDARSLIKPTTVYIRDFVKDLGTLSNQRKALNNEYKALKVEWSAMAAELVKNLKNISHGVHRVQKAANRLAEKIAGKSLDPDRASPPTGKNQDSVVNRCILRSGPIKKEVDASDIAKASGTVKATPPSLANQDMKKEPEPGKEVNPNILRSGPIKEEVDASDIAKASGTVNKVAAPSLANQDIKNESEPVKDVQEAQPNAQMGVGINALTRAAARSIQTQQYLDQRVVPMLFQALAPVIRQAVAELAKDRLGEKIVSESMDVGVVNEQMLASLKEFKNRDSVAEIPPVKETEVRSESQETTARVNKEMDRNVPKAPETTPEKEVKEAQPDAQMGGDTNSLTPAAAQSIPTRQYLDHTVVPILFQALADRPENQVDYLVKNGYIGPGRLRSGKPE